MQRKYSLFHSFICHRQDNNEILILLTSLHILVWRTHGDPAQRTEEGKGADRTPHPATLNQLLNVEDLTRQKANASPKDLDLI